MLMLMRITTGITTQRRTDMDMQMVITTIIAIRIRKPIATPTAGVPVGISFRAKLARPRAQELPLGEMIF